MTTAIAADLPTRGSAAQTFINVGERTNVIHYYPSSRRRPGSVQASDSQTTNASPTFYFQLTLGQPPACAGVTEVGEVAQLTSRDIA